MHICYKVICIYVMKFYAYMLYVYGKSYILQSYKLYSTSGELSGFSKMSRLISLF